MYLQPFVSKFSKEAIVYVCVCVCVCVERDRERKRMIVFKELARETMGADIHRVD